MVDLKILANDIHQTAVEKGFWEKSNIAEKLMLIVSELSEACEADRNRKRCKKPILGIYGWTSEEVFKDEFEKYVKDSFEDELADAIIRILDLVASENIDIEAHVLAKHRYNKMREYKHGKKY